MSASLLWSINDFQAYENLSGWGTKVNWDTHVAIKTLPQFYCLRVRSSVLWVIGVIFLKSTNGEVIRGHLMVQWSKAIHQKCVPVLKYLIKYSRDNCTRDKCNFYYSSSCNFSFFGQFHLLAIYKLTWPPFMTITLCVQISWILLMKLSQMMC